MDRVLDIQFDDRRFWQDIDIVLNDSRPISIEFVKQYLLANAEKYLVFTTYKQ